MEIARSAEELDGILHRARGEGRTIGFVPTMGAFHEGHLSLMRAARTQSDCVVVSIYVNPTQFGPGEDLAAYPRRFEEDLALARGIPVDVVFAPSDTEMYPEGFCTYVTQEGLTSKLCGRSRPTHFRGVTTIVAKLLNLVRPDIVFFGQKDAQQCAVVRRMCRDLGISVQIIVCPTVREEDGLAMSSRNKYLNEAERSDATSLYRALSACRNAFSKGERDAGRLVALMREILEQPASARVDYVEIVDPDTLEGLDEAAEGSLVACAVRIGETRLIDNVILTETS